MSVYPDASYLLSLFTNDLMTARAKAYLYREKPQFVVSDFASAEFASVTARCVRIGLTTKDEARAAFATFDVWTARLCERVQMVSADVTAAESYLRRLDLTLRTPDALHIGIAQRIGASLATFDKKMIVAAGRLGSTLVKL